MISWQLASLTFPIRQSGTLKLLLFQLGYRKFCYPETPGFEGQKTRVSGLKNVRGPRPPEEPRGGNPSQSPLIQWAPGGPRATNLILGVINKTVQITMLGLNMESIVSFPHNTFQTGEGVIGAVIPVITVSWIHCFSRKSQC